MKRSTNPLLKGIHKKHPAEKELIWLKLMSAKTTREMTVKQAGAVSEAFTRLTRILQHKN